MKKIALLLAAALVIPSAANAAVFANGSFETGTVSGSYSSLASGSTAITGWVVGGAGIDYINTYWTAGAGSRSLDLSGTNAGSISQSFDTVIGKTYLVDFLMAGNPDGGAALKSMNVLATGGVTQTYDFNTSGNSKSNMGWAANSYSFKANSTSTTLSFTSLSASAFGPALDGVTLTAAVPEPATWAMMIGGFALVGAGMRRRATRSAIAFG